MLKLITINNPRLAQSFIDYMAYRGIELELKKEPDNQFALWLLKLEDQLEVEAELEAFLRDPLAKKYQRASWDMAESRRAKYHYPSPHSWQSIKQKAGFFTLLVMGCAAVVYFALSIGFGTDFINWMHFPAGVSQQWQLWRLFSHALLHFSTLHIVFNLLWWWVLGGNIEKTLGSAKLMRIFLLSALFSGFAQYLFLGPAFGGLSGVIYALLGYSWMLTRFAPERGLHIDNSYFGFMLVWLVIGFVEPFGMQIANMAHLAGLITGLVLGLLETRKVAFKG